MTLKEYIQGNRKGREANQLEREAMNDPFLHEALDGMDAVDGDHLSAIEALERGVVQPAIHRRKALVYWVMAASVLLLVGFGSLFLFQHKIADHLPDIAAVKSSNTTSANQESHDVGAVAPEKPNAVVPSLAAVEKPARRKVKNEPITPASAPVPVPEPVEVLSKGGSFEKSEIAPGVVVQLAGKIKLQGTVVDEHGEPIIGAVIKEKVSNAETISDLDGNFRLTVNSKDSMKLVASYVGYDNKEFTASDTPVRIRMEPSAVLNEVVVAGYGISHSKNNTNLLAAKKADDAGAVFGEKEFSDYCKKNGLKELCSDREAAVKVSFALTPEGKPSDIKVLKSSCPEAEFEIKRLLKLSPRWSNPGRKVTMKVSW